jgi:uncharacterized linocin/CFP29 family protein
MNYNGNSFMWTQDRQQSINKMVWEAAKDVRVIRPFLKLYGKQGEYATNIVGHQVTSGKAGTPLNIAINQNLTPVKLSCDIQVHQEQFKEEDMLHTLAVEAAYRVAAAEEAVLVLGKSAGDFLARLNVTPDENLEQQTGLFPANPPALHNTTLLDSIVQGIKDLQAKGRFRNYVAIVSLDLYQEAMKPRQNPFDAQIYEIRPLLMEEGFLYSQAAPEKTGVLLSLSGDSVKLAVPVDTCMEFVEEKKDAFLQVVEQIRLLIDVPDAVVPLKDVVPAK